ncbi:MAG: ABC transporter substrate-binding protein [Thiomargarita sp.]|nr:ABC transporter substrate-binding protein [Thiomargarita sp.]
MSLIKNLKNIFFAILTIGIILYIYSNSQLLSTEKLNTSPILYSKSFPREIYDSNNRKLLIPEPPQRIVSQTLSTDEILLAICLPERIIAVSSLAKDVKQSIIAQQAQQIPHQASNNAEQILNLKPDLIFIASYSRAEIVELLQITGAPVFQFSQFRSISDIENNIRIIGYIIGEEQKAAELILQMKTNIQVIRNHLPKNKPVLRVMLYSQWGYVAGRNTTFDDMMQIIGAINIGAEHGIDGHLKISSEQILAWQPDVIVTGAILGEFENVKQFLLKNPAIAASQAAKMDKIIVIDIRYLNTVSHYMVTGIKNLAEALYGVTIDY